MKYEVCIPVKVYDSSIGQEDKCGIKLEVQADCPDQAVEKVYLVFQNLLKEYGSMERSAEYAETILGKQVPLAEPRYFSERAVELGTVPSYSMISTDLRTARMELEQLKAIIAEGAGTGAEQLTSLIELLDLSGDSSFGDCESAIEKLVNGDTTLTSFEVVGFEYDDGACRGLRFSRNECRGEKSIGVLGDILPDKCVTPLVRLSDAQAMHTRSNKLCTLAVSQLNESIKTCDDIQKLLMEARAQRDEAREARDKANAKLEMITDFIER